MDVELLEKQLEFWKRGVFVAIGSSLTLLATAIAESPRSHLSSQLVWAWYIVWVVIWLSIAPLGFFLLMSRQWRKVPLSIRLNVAYGYLCCAWLVLLSAGIKGYSSGDHACNTLVIITAFILGASYYYLRKKKSEPEEMFP
jgi:hypothetical protein